MLAIDAKLAALPPAAQVAAVLKGLPKGDMPDLPPFLIVTPAEAERRKAWWDAHPPQPAVFTPAVPEERSFKHEAEVKKVERLRKLRESKNPSSWVMRLLPEERRWSTRLGRFVPESIPGLNKMPFKAALQAIEDAGKVWEREHAADKRRVAKRIEEATTTRHARPVKATTPVKAEPAKPRAVGAVKGNEADATTVSMLKREGGVTQAELATALGCTGDAARGRISKVCRAQNLAVTRPEMPGRGKVYKVQG